MYMSLEEINKLPDPMKGVALAMYNENVKLRAEMEAPDAPEKVQLLKGLFPPAAKVLAVRPEVGGKAGTSSSPACPASAKPDSAPSGTTAARTRE